MFHDERGVPQHPVTCVRCGVQVLVKKNSLAHTVMQWTSATDACAELAGAAVPRALTPTCAFLADSVDTAVRAQELEVGDLVPPPRADSRSAGARSSPPPGAP